MKTPKRFAAAMLAPLALVLMTSATLHAEQPAFTWTHDDPGLEWLDCPPYFPQGCAMAVLQGDPSEHNADIFLRLEPDSDVPLHYHTSVERMVLISGKFEVDYDGQEPVVMTAGTYAYGPAKLPHTARCHDAGQCVLFIAFEKPIDAPEGRP